MDSHINMPNGDVRRDRVGLDLHQSSDTALDGLRAFGRGTFDRVFAALAILFFLPVFTLIAVWMLLTERGPVFFAHERVGKNGKLFKCHKFRTMAVDADAQLAELLASDPVARAQWNYNQKLDDDPRVTCLGELLRKSSLDELPQFWNVLVGQMSVVGPRPIVRTEMVRYGDDIDAYLSVKPGVTGAWQVNGRSKTTYAERVEMDATYVRTRTFGQDLRIILKTIKVVVCRDGAV